MKFHSIHRDIGDDENLGIWCIWEFKSIVYGYNLIKNMILSNLLLII
jgi:hypothetical protein